MRKLRVERGGVIPLPTKVVVRGKDPGGHRETVLPPINDRLRLARDYSLNRLEDRIAAAQKKSGFCVMRNLKRLQEVVEGGEDRDAISAIKVGTEITGEKMPERTIRDVNVDVDILARLVGV